MASALAIILSYHQWPERGTGTLPGYYWSSGGTRIEDHPLGYVYDWNQPPVPLTEDKVTEFCKWACMVTHIYPDRGGEAYPVFDFDAFTPFPWDFRSKSFTIGSRTLEAYSSEVVEVPMGYALFDRKGRFKEILCDPVLVRSDNPRIPELTCNIPSTIEEGDCLKLALQVNGVWTPINETTRSFVEFHPGKKLSEIICLDHTILDEIYSLFDLPYLYLRGEKAVYWEIWSADEDVCMATSRDISRYGKVGDELYFVLTKWDSDANQYRVEFNFPPGNYRLLLRNFDEEITATIKM